MFVFKSRMEYPLVSKGLIAVCSGEINPFNSRTRVHAVSRETQSGDGANLPRIYQ